MARLSEANVLIAREIISRYPRPKSALIPLLHLAQEQDGHITTDAMATTARVACARCRRERSWRTIFKIAARSVEPPAPVTDRTSSISE